MLRLQDFSEPFPGSCALLPSSAPSASLTFPCTLLAFPSFPFLKRLDQDQAVPPLPLPPRPAQSARRVQRAGRKSWDGGGRRGWIVVGRIFLEDLAVWFPSPGAPGGVGGMSGVRGVGSERWLRKGTRTRWPGAAWWLWQGWGPCSFRGGTGAFGAASSPPGPAPGARPPAGRSPSGW